MPSASGGERLSFKRWLGKFQWEALSKGISKSTLDKALTNLKRIPRVIELDRTQPEFRLTLEKYLSRRVPASLVSEGRRKLAANRDVLEKISRHYGVQSRFLVALWGVETKFGQSTGGFPVIGALATLAYDSRRSTFFRQELFEALRVLEERHISFDEMKGSWAGAMGQIQFMPSSFHKFAVDYDGDGRKDIWKNLQDAFASAANYLVQSGWRPGQNWGREVILPKGFTRDLVGLENRKRLSEWQLLGVRGPRDLHLPQKPDFLASLVQPDGKGGRAFLAYQNYRTILKWNRSHFFGIAVGTFADRLVKR